MKALTAITFLIVTLTIFATLTICGCGSGGVPVNLVTGEVRYDGKPVGGAMVIFVPSADTAGTHFASAVTESDGTFIVQTAGANANGAAAGEYIVTVTKTAAVDDAGNEIAAQAETPSQYDPTRPVTEESSRPLMKNFLPEQYTSRETSPLKAKVKKGKNHFKLELEGK
ncbi:MAG: hypothetical protein LBH00_01250 [Planctomycetaceae bacterium]|jgi:hypothetical protein|nr:hypothetical protein [Planctomycetaceae bacterium]